MIGPTASLIGYELAIHYETVRPFGFRNLAASTYFVTNSADFSMIFWFWRILWRNCCRLFRRWKSCLLLFLLSLASFCCFGVGLAGWAGWRGSSWSGRMSWLGVSSLICRMILAQRCWSWIILCWQPAFASISSSFDVGCLFAIVTFCLSTCFHMFHSLMETHVCACQKSAPNQLWCVLLAQWSFFWRVFVRTFMPYFHFSISANPSDSVLFSQSCYILASSGQPQNCFVLTQHHKFHSWLSPPSCLSDHWADFASRAIYAWLSISAETLMYLCLLSFWLHSSLILIFQYFL